MIIGEPFCDGSLRGTRGSVSAMVHLLGVVGGESRPDDALTAVLTPQASRDHPRRGAADGVGCGPTGPGGRWLC